MRLLPAIVASALLAHPCFTLADGHTSAPRAVGHDDVWLMHRLGTPVPSPDGKWAVFPVTEPSYEEDGTISDLWVVPVDGRAPARRLTATESPESSARATSKGCASRVLPSCT